MSGGHFSETICGGIPTTPPCLGDRRMFNRYGSRECIVMLAEVMPRRRADFRRSHSNGWWQRLQPWDYSSTPSSATKSWGKHLARNTLRPIPAPSLTNPLKELGTSPNLFGKSITTGKPVQNDDYSGKCPRSRVRVSAGRRIQQPRANQLCSRGHSRHVLSLGVAEN